MKETDKTIHKTVVFETAGRRAKYYADDNAVFVEIGIDGKKAGGRCYLESCDIDFLKHVFKEMGL